MESFPFLFGRIVDGPYFINRDQEVSRLTANLTSGLNTVIISPRRWGKSSLVNRVVKRLSQNKNFRVCTLDLFNIRSEKEFTEIYAREILKCASAKWEEWLETGKKFLSALTPRFNFGPDPYEDFSVSFDFQARQQHLEDVLNLPEKIGRSRKLRIIVCIDEFQNLSHYDDPVAFQKKLRSAWQHHKSVTYCLYGSKRHMMSEVFESQSSPFYKFGDVMFLNKIETHHWLAYISESFRKTRKSVSEENCLKIITTAANHPYFVQQLALRVWLHTDKKVTEQTVHKAVDDVLTENSILYLRDMESLSNTQINFLHAVCLRVEQLSSSDTLKKFNLGTSANVLRIKKALEQKEILDFFGPYPEFTDPFFELWLKRIYFHDHPRNY